MIALEVSTPSAIVALLAGGALIQPAGIILSRALGRSGAPEARNPLKQSALEAAAWLILCLPVAAASDAAPWLCAFVVAAIEAAFAAGIYVPEMRRDRPAPSSEGTW